MRIFVAGATGAIGLPLVQMLIQAGHSVVGMTQSSEGAQRLQREGCEAIIASALDPAAVKSALHASKPEVVIDQLTSLQRTRQLTPQTSPGTYGCGLRVAAICCGLQRRLGFAVTFSRAADSS